MFGAVLDSLLLHTRRSQRLPRRLWPLVQSQAACATAAWREPDQGIWEARGKPQHYVSSKLMGWVALDRAAKLATIRDDNARPNGARPPRRSGRTFSPTASVSAAYSASITTPTPSTPRPCWLAVRIPPRHRRASAQHRQGDREELTENGYVLRYRTDETDDGLSGKEGTFLICSYWLVSALAIVGEMERARA